MKTPITTAQAMSHPDVALTINTLGKMADELREERDALTNAARLALDVLSDERYVSRYSQITEAIAALKAVLK